MNTEPTLYPGELKVQAKGKEKTADKEEKRQDRERLADIFLIKCSCKLNVITLRDNQALPNII